MPGRSVLATAAVLVLAGCGSFFLFSSSRSSSSSFSTICNRWTAEAHRDAVSAGHYGQQFVVQFQSMDSPARLASIRQHIATAYYRLQTAKDLHGGWKQAAACPTPGM